MVTFAKEVRLQGIKDGIWDGTREFNRNVVAGIVGGLKMKFVSILATFSANHSCPFGFSHLLIIFQASGFVAPQKKRSAPSGDNGEPSMKRERGSESAEVSSF